MRSLLFLIFLLYCTAILSQNERPEMNGMVFVEGGTFLMGTKGRGGIETPHFVTVSDYYIARHEVTFEEYDSFCQATGREKTDDQGWGRGMRPVIEVSWYEAIEYCNWKSAEERLTPAYTINKATQDPNNKSKDDTLKWTISINWKANGYRLPTEAEWEYAARSRGKDQEWAGTSSMDQLTSFANARGDADGYKNTSPVGTFKANDLGLFDMSGNVYEWCWDWFYFEYDFESTIDDPTGPNTGSSRILRGGSWFNLPVGLRNANRQGNTPNIHLNNVGFRLSRTGH